MRTLRKALLVVVFPLLVLAGYQFFTVHQTFDMIEGVRSGIFVESAREVKYANDVLFLTGMLNSNLFEIYLAAEARDAFVMSQAVRKYREIQLQRYHSLQKLKEVVSQKPDSTFDFLRVLDSDSSETVAGFEKKINEIDELNETIIVRMTSLNDESFDSIAGEITESNELTRQLTGELAAFTNERYIKIENTSQLVGESENRAQNTLNMVLLLGYGLAAIMVLFINTLILRPLERFVRAIELKSMEKVEWGALDPIRQDEIGFLYRALNEFLLPVQTKTIHSRAKRKSFISKKKKTPRSASAE